MVPTDGALLALAAALAAACFVKASASAFSAVRVRRRRRRRARSIACRSRRCACSRRLCVLAGIFPGVVIDALAPVVNELSARRLPTQLGLPWLSIVPIAAAAARTTGCWSSCSSSFGHARRRRDPSLASRARAPQPRLGLRLS